MKKGILFLFSVFISLLSHAQNYQCLQSSVKHYFINNNGYLRGIRIDSVRYVGGDSVFYPFRTLRGSYDASIPILSTLTPGGSWLGKKVIQQNDGTFIFDSYWNDSVIIKTRANIGDSWVFYNDSGSVYYQAVVISADTLTVLHSVDSVKTIMINAFNSSGHLPSDPLDSFRIILSKNHGFVQVFDLYTFPYHEPDSAYRPGLDFFLDRSTLTTSTINNFTGNPPNESITNFMLVDLVIPNDQQLFNWNAGDIFHGEHEYAAAPLGFSTINFMDTVASKVISGSANIDSVVGTHITCPTALPCSLICNRGVYTFYNSTYRIISPSYLPESGPIPDFFLYYYPDDTSFCTHSPGYTRIANGFPGYSLDYSTETKVYKLGIGLTYYAFVWPSGSVWEWDRLKYCKINGIDCGTPFTVATESVKDINHQSLYQIFPNPATNELTITTGSNQPYTITLMNFTGQTVKTVHTTGTQETINTSNLPTGIYNLSITDENGNRHNEKVVIMH